MLKSDRTLKSLLFVNAVLLGIIAFRPFFTATAVRAQVNSNDVYIEPGVYMLRAPNGQRQVLGKVVVDLRSGNVWGFPTLSGDPYPVNTLNQDPQTSHPLRLGRFAVEDMNK